MSHFLLFILALFVLAALLRIDFFFSILYLFVAVYLVVHLWSRRMLRQLNASRRLQSHAFQGDTVEVTIRVENQGRLPIPWLLLSESYPVNLSSPPFFREVVSLAGRASHTRQYSLVARQRGYYRIGPLTLQAGDLLGLKPYLTRQLDPDYLIVYPKILPIAELGLPTASPQAVLSTPLPLFHDPARMIGLRDYHPGDNPRSIHWPATAATGSMLVKQFQPAIARDTAIFLNLDRQDYARRGYPETAVELAITVAASLAHHIVTLEKLPVGLNTTALDPLTGQVQSFALLPARGRGHLLQILEVLARVQAANETAFLERVRQEVVHLTWGTTLVVITAGYESPELVQTLLLLKRSGFRVTLAYIYPTSGYGRAVEEQVRQLNIPVYKIWREKDIATWSPVQ